ncbi:hypothetical protein AHAS_Ahas10G0095200 [Arachis hypogaea]
MEKELEQSRDATKAASAITARAAELETELARLQHDSISAIRAAEEMMVEVAKLRKLLPEIESKVKLLEREVEFLKKDKSEKLGYGVNGGVNGNEVIARDGKGVKGLNVQWPVVAAGSTVVAAAAVIWFYFWLIHENNEDDGFLYGLMFIKPVNFDFLLKSWNTCWLLVLSSEELKQNCVLSLLTA